MKKLLLVLVWIISITAHLCAQTQPHELQLKRIASVGDLPETGYPLQRLSVGGFSTGSGLGGGMFVWIPTRNKNTHNGGTVVDPSHKAVPGSVEWYSPSTTPGAGCWVRVYEGAIHATWFGLGSIPLQSNHVALNKALSVAASVTDKPPVILPMGELGFTGPIVMNQGNELTGVGHESMEAGMRFPSRALVYHAGNGIELASNVTVKNLRLQKDSGFAGTGIGMASGFGETTIGRFVYIDGVEMLNFGVGAYLNRWSNVVKNSAFIGSSNSVMSVGLLIAGNTWNNHITHSKFITQNGTGISVAVPVASDTEFYEDFVGGLGVFIAHNWFESNATGIKIEVGRQISVNNNYFENSSIAGIHLAGNSDDAKSTRIYLSATENFFFNAREGAASSTASALRWAAGGGVFEGNTVVSRVTDDQGMSYGIYVAGGNISRRTPLSLDNNRMEVVRSSISAVVDQGLFPIIKGRTTTLTRTLNLADLPTTYTTPIHLPGSDGMSYRISHVVCSIDVAPDAAFNIDLGVLGDDSFDFVRDFSPATTVGSLSAVTDFIATRGNILNPVASDTPLLLRLRKGSATSGIISVACTVEMFTFEE